MCWKSERITYEIEVVFDWGGVVHWSKEVMFQSQNAHLFEETVTHKELL